MKTIDDWGQAPKQNSLLRAGTHIGPACMVEEALGCAATESTEDVRRMVYKRL